jgi:hypothetical protein
MTRVTIPVKLGNLVLQVIEGANGDVECHMVMIVFPVQDDGKLGQPAFLSSLIPDQMEDVLIQVAGNFALLDKSKRVIDGIDEQ